MNISNFNDSLIGELEITRLKSGKNRIYKNQFCLCKCEKCGKIIKNRYRSFLNNFKKSNRIYCKKCAALENREKACLAARKSEKRIAKAIIQAKKLAAHQKGKTLEELYGEEKAKIIKAKLSKLAKGSGNPMYGKPSPKGSGNGWSGWYKNWFFRSLRELSYMVNVIEKNCLSWRTGETKEYRIHYLDPFTGNERTYHPDFVINENTIIEVKPKKLINTMQNKAKYEAARKWCKNNNYKFKIETSATFQKLKDEEIKKLYERKQITWLKRYEEKYLTMYCK
jgi:hypothetical protein